jgi:hypothetical protein
MKTGNDEMNAIRKRLSIIVLVAVGATVAAVLLFEKGPIVTFVSVFVTIAWIVCFVYMLKYFFLMFKGPRG